MSGIKFLKIAAERWPDTVRIVLTCMAELESIQDVLDAGLFAYFQKPWDREKLVMDMLQAVEAHDLKRRDTEHRASLEWVASLSRAFRIASATGILKKAAAYIETGSIYGARS